ncbi:hypothetical protein [Streptomyces sp. NPDC002994]|uniref:hypothetical protein n=1 Tax=Streptomyces sp. NPDC002994 TaxID=3154441 RepID=UPI0033B1289B
MRVGWGQQLRYAVDFGNEPTLGENSAEASFVDTAAYSPGRRPISGGGEFTDHTMYLGKPAAVDSGTVPVAWTNRWETAGHVVPVRSAGDYYIAVSLGPEAATFAENPAIGVVLRVDVVGDELAGPQHDAPVLVTSDNKADNDGDRAVRADSTGAGGAGWTGTATAVAAGGAVVLAAGLGFAVFAAMRRRAAAKETTRGGA